MNDKDEIHSTPMTKKSIPLNNPSGRNQERTMHNLRKSILSASSKEISISVKKYQANLRTAQLFELISRPPLLYQPCLNVSLPFNRRHDEIVPIVSMSARGSAFIPDPDPCLLSIDGFLDSLIVLKNILSHLCFEADTTSKEVLDCTLKRLDKGILRIQDLKIGLKDFILGGIIGSGAYGIVRTVEERNNPGKVYALKSQYKNAWMYQDCWQQLILERTVLAQATCIQNPWIPQLHYAFQDNDQVHLVMDYQPGGDMYIYLNKAGHLLDDSMIKQYIAEVVEAVHSLHKMGYIHCDIKPENIAIESSGHLKLLDFGSAIRLDADGKAVCPTNVGTKEYLNIELLRQRDSPENLLVGPEYDYWAIGVFLYEMYYSRTPFYDEDDKALFDNIKDYENKMCFPNDVDIPDLAKDLIMNLVCEPCDRFTYDEVTRHAYFEDVEFAALRSRHPIYIPDLIDDRCTRLFEGGKSRPRDENITIVATNKTFSPKSLKGKRIKENSEIHKKRELILQAMSSTNEDPQPDLEDYEWEGIPCVRDLPFIGFSFTPGLTLQMKKIIQQRELCLRPVENVEEKFLDHETSINDSITTLKMSRLQEENDLILANAALQKRVKFLTNFCEQKLNQTNAAVSEPKNTSASEDKTITFLTNALETSKLEYSKLIKDSEKARYVYVEAMDLIAAINRLMMVSSRPISEEDVFANLIDKKLEIEEISKNITNLNYDQIHIVDRTLILIFQIIKRYAMSLANSHSRYEDLSLVKNSTEEKMRKELVKLNDIVKKLVDEKSLYEDKIQKLSQRLEKSESKSKKFERDYEEYADKYFCLREKMRSSQSVEPPNTTQTSIGEKDNTKQLSSVSTDTKDIETDHAAKVKELKSMLDEVKAENNGLKTEISIARKEIGEASLQSIEDKKIQSELRNQICQLRLQLECNANQWQEIELKLSRNENTSKEIQMLRQEYEDAKCQLVKCENELLNSSQRERSLHSEIKMFQEQNQALIQEIQNVKTSYAKELELIRMEKRFDESNQAENWGDKYRKLEKELHELHEQHKEDAAKLERSRILNMQLSSQRDSYIDDLRTANIEMSTLQSEIGKIQGDYEDQLTRVKESNRQYMKLIEYLRSLVPESALMNDPVSYETLMSTKSNGTLFSNSGSTKSSTSLRTKLRNPSTFFTKPDSKKSLKAMTRSRLHFKSPNRKDVKFTLKSATNLNSQTYRFGNSEEYDIENIPPVYNNQEEWIRSNHEFLSEGEFDNLASESTQSSPRESFVSDSYNIKRQKDWSKSVANFDMSKMRSYDKNQRNLNIFNKLTKVLHHKSKRSEFL